MSDSQPVDNKAASGEAAFDKQPVDDKAASGDAATDKRPVDDKAASGGAATDKRPVDDKAASGGAATDKRLIDNKAASGESATDLLLAKYTERLAAYTKWLMVAAVLSLVCTAWIAWSTKDLRDFAQIQAQDIKTQIQLTHDAVDVATRQAQAIEGANRQALESSRRQLRPEVVVTAVERPTFPAGDMQIRIHFRNVGQTAAYELTDYISEDIVALQDYGPSSSYSVAPNPEEKEFKTTLGAGTEFARQEYRSAKKKYSDRDLRDFKNGKRVYLVWGVVYYKDYSLVDHYIRYCRYFENGDLSVFDICSVHNDSN
jgi:hypothetical protein